MSGIIPAILLALVILGAMVVIAFALLRGRETRTLEERLEEFGTLDEPMSLEELELSQPFSERVLLPFVRRVAEFMTRFTPQQSMENLRHKLELAGDPYGWGPMEFMGVRALVLFLFGGLGVFLFFASPLAFIRRLMLSLVFIGIGFFLPTLFLMVKINRRQYEITRALPDALDLLTICVEAGLGFDAAMAKVVDKWEDELSLEFARVIQEIQLGKLRREALRDMADRTEVPDVSTFVAAIIQADQLGVSIARVLRIQSDQMRMRRRQRAEKLARESQVKILPPVVFFIFPAILVILLGPAVIQVMEIGIFGTF